MWLDKAHLGECSVDRHDALAGQHGTWTFTYVTGSYGIEDSGAIRLAWRMVSDWEMPQFTDKTKSGYSTLTTSSGAELSVTYDRFLRPYTNSLLVRVVRGSLKPGDTVTGSAKVEGSETSGTTTLEDGTIVTESSYEVDRKVDATTSEIKTSAEKTTTDMSPVITDIGIDYDMWGGTGKVRWDYHVAYDEDGNPVIFTSGKQLTNSLMAGEYDFYWYGAKPLTSSKYFDGITDSEGNLRLVLSVIKRFGNSNENVDDLFQIGCVGLIKAINNFNTELDVKFSTYAVPMIIGEIRRYMRDNSSIRVSRSLRDTAYKAIYAKENYMKRNLREPTVQEIAAEIGIPKEDIVFAMDAIQTPMSLQEPVYNDGEDALYVMDQISDKKNREENWVEELALQAAMDCLDERERYIIRLRFFEGKTQMEVAQEIRISQAQVSRLEKHALKMMRNYLR